MTNNQDHINLLLEKLNILLKKQDDFSREINILKIEIDKLRDIESQSVGSTEKVVRPISEKTARIEDKKVGTGIPIENQTELYPKSTTQKKPAPLPKKTPKRKTDLEKLIGENLINKVGIVITIIGVAIGAKYSIENDLISPLTRIILGYLTGLGLLGFGIKLKKNYENYSAVLVSGAIAILYFITYAAYIFYGLISQVMAFPLMVIFTSFTVIAAIFYNKQVIAHIGLVGAYAVPFLLSDGSGNIVVLFSYISIINIGILVIAFKKYWKPLYYSSFGLTWLIYVSWFLFDYNIMDHFSLGLLFLSLFFITFYTIFLANKLLQNEKFVLGDIVLLLSNSFIFYGLGYAILSNHETGKSFLGVFTLANALIHFIVGLGIYRRKLADRNLFYLVLGLVLVFITIAIPVQLDGNWVTLIWAFEAALLFWIGRTKNIPIYERLSYPLLFLAFFSIVQDWSTVYQTYYPENPETRITPLMNIHFLTSVLFILAFGFIHILNGNKNYPSPATSSKSLGKLISFSIPAILIAVIYFAFRLEIANYWYQLYTDSEIVLNPENQDYSNYYKNYDLKKFKSIWILNYSMFFVSLLAFLNFRKLKNQLLGYINMGLMVIILMVFLTQGLYELSELRESYLSQSLSEYYQIGMFHIGIRYVSLVLVAILLMTFRTYLRQEFLKRKFTIAFDVLMLVAILWISSSELIHWMDMAQLEQSYKLGLSILWGVYSLSLIAIGIWKNKKHVRIAAIVWFGITLIKLFFYDISHLDTISKTVVFVSLGILLLIISFLYNKYKQKITDEASN